VKSLPVYGLCGGMTKTSKGQNNTIWGSCGGGRFKPQCKAEGEDLFIKILFI